MKELLIEIWTDNWIGAKGAIMINELLKKNTTLTELNLGSDEFHNIIMNNYFGNLQFFGSLNKDSIIESKKKYWF